MLAQASAATGILGLGEHPDQRLRPDGRTRIRPFRPSPRSTLDLGDDAEVSSRSATWTFSFDCGNRDMTPATSLSRRP